MDISHFQARHIRFRMFSGRKWQSLIVDLDLGTNWGTRVTGRTREGSGMATEYAASLASVQALPGSPPAPGHVAVLEPGGCRGVWEVLSWCWRQGLGSSATDLQHPP